MKLFTVNLILFCVPLLFSSTNGYNDLESLSKSLLELNEKLLLNSLKQDENTLYSPLGIADALSVLMLGAKGETERSIFTLLSAKHTAVHHLSFKTLIEYYNKDKNGTKIVNWILVNSNNRLNEIFAKSADRLYKSRVDIVNFTSDSKPAMKMINSGVENMTDGKISHIQKAPFDKRSVMVLINAISFKEKWLNPFITEDTQLMTFSNSDGTKSKVKMMYHEFGQIKYIRDKNLHVKITELPYEDNYTMIVLLPMSNHSLEELLPTIGFPKIIELVDKSNNQKVEVFLPKFKLNVESDLKQLLGKMNLTVPFSSSADFGGIADGSLYVTEAKHDAVIDVNEEGTEAVAVTKLIVSSKTNPKLFLANRPFAFLIRDKQYNIPLFCGVVNKL